MNDSDFMLTESAMTDLAARIRALGMNLNKSTQKKGGGEDYHAAFRRHLATMAEMFDCQLRREEEWLFDDVGVTGGGDIVWVRKKGGGGAVVVFEMDSTVKLRSFQKLKAATALHKVWIYCGRDVWGFRTFLQKNDPGREITPVIVPTTFVPSFADGS